MNNISIKHEKPPYYKSVLCFSKINGQETKFAICARVSDENGDFYIIPHSNSIFENVTHWRYISFENDATKLFSDLYNQIKHGDDEHQQWLKDKMDEFLENYK